MDFFSPNPFLNKREGLVIWHSNQCRKPQVGIKLVYLFNSQGTLYPIFLSNCCIAIEKNEDFSKLIHWPEVATYSCKASLMTWTSCWFAQQNNKESLANNRWEILKALLHIETPWSRPSSSTFASKDVKPSAHKINKILSLKFKLELIFY